MRTRLKQIVRLCRRALFHFGFDAHIMMRSLKALPSFLRDIRQYSKTRRPDSAFPIFFKDLFPILNEKDAGAGSASGHYFHQDLWAARKIYGRRPKQHYDIGSRIDGFIAHLLTFMPVVLIDIRPLGSVIDGLSFLCDDATELGTLKDGTIESLSSLHAAEHFGLGRYSDPVDPAACFRFMAALERVLAPDGRLYFSVPIGRERVEFNAHRVFAVETVLQSFPRLHLVSFSTVGDDGQLYENVDPASIPRYEFGCGLFEFTKAE